MTEQQQERLGLAGATLTVLSLTVGWYVLWIRPHDEFIGQVMACTQDASRAEYARCVEVVQVSSR